VIVSKLKDIAKVISGYAFKSSDFLSDNGIPAIKIKNIKNGDIDLSECDFVDRKFLSLNEKYHLKRNDILVSLTGSHLTQPNSVVGRIALYRHSFTSLLNQRAGKVIPYKNLVDPLYLYAFLSQDSIKETIAKKARGAANQANISPGDVEDTEILLPPLHTQRRIASILSSYDDLIENNLKRIKLLEEIAQRTYEEWFVKFRVNGEQLPIDEKTGLPVGWSIIEFQDVGQIVTGKTPSTTNQLFFDGEIPFVKTPDMSGFPYVLATSQCLSELGANTQKNKYIPKNSLMVSCIGSAGVIALASQSCQTNQQINAIVFKESIFTFYFYCFAKGLKPVLEALGSNGATMTNVNKGKFQKIKIVCPNLETIEEFHGLSNPIFELILDLQKQNQKLKESRDILLPKLMNPNYFQNVF
jgi:type I restriction enzyme S subunit